MLANLLSLGVSNARVKIDVPAHIRSRRTATWRVFLLSAHTPYCRATSIILSGNFIDYTYTFPLIMHFSRRRGGNRIAVTYSETNWS